MQDHIDIVKVFLIVICQSICLKVLLFTAGQSMVGVLLCNLSLYPQLPFDVRIVWIFLEKALHYLLHRTTFLLLCHQ